MKSYELRNLLHQHLSPEDLAQRGWTNYSGLDVLSEERNGIYVIGFNPGADDSNKKLNEYEPEQSSEWSAYVDVCWRRHTHQMCQHGQIELVKHQIGVLGLARELGVPVQKIFGTNAIFVATNRVGQLARTEIARLWERCWPIHQAFLAEMRPRLIITLGNGNVSAFELLKSKADPWQRMGEAVSVEGRYRPWRAGVAKFALAEGQSLSVNIVGLPHPSWPHFFGLLADNFRAYEERVPS